ILFMVAWNMSELRHVVKMIKRAPRADVFILVATFCLTVFADLVVAVNIGVVLAMLHFMRRMAESVVVRKQDAGSLKHELQREGWDELPANVLVYSVDGPFFFAAADAFQRALGTTHGDPGILIIRLGHVPFIDATGLQAMETVVLSLHERGVRVIVSEPNPRVYGKLRKMGLVDKLGPDDVVPTFAQALARIDQPVEGSVEGSVPVRGLTP